MDYKKTTVSIITPFYKGNQYLEKLFLCIKKNAIDCKKDCDIEFILVNDNPQESIIYDNTWVEGFHLSIVKNKKNVGIHQSRVNGLDIATGEYVIFLDQDDDLTTNAVLSRYHARETYDVVVSNGIDENPLNYGKIYKNEKRQNKLLVEDYYYLIGNMISSPGQCMIRKNAIPVEWKKNIVKNNGSDDLLLWLMMFRKGCTFGLDYNLTYTHVYTGENLSTDFQRMRTSSEEVLTILKETVGITKKQELDFIRRFKMRQMYDGKGVIKKIFAYCCFPDIAYTIIKSKL